MKANKNIAAIISLIFCVILFSVHYSSAAVKGKIAGKVYDTDTNEPLVGANVFIEGTNLGAAANMDGEFFILNVPPGKFTVTASMIGYETMKKTEVLVQIGQTTQVDFNLKMTAIEGLEVVVVAEKAIIQKDVSNSQTILQGADIAIMPVGNIKELLDKQVGIQEVDARGLFMRGQRQSAISLMLDGFETRDNIDDQVYTRVNPDEIEQVEISAGGYDASYGNASAGVISFVSKEGGNKYSGTFDFRQTNPARKHFGPPLKHYWDIFFLEGWENTLLNARWKPRLTGNPDDVMATTWETKAHQVPRSSPFRDRPNLLKELYLWRMRDEVTNYGEQPDGVMSATFGGPVPFLKNTTFFSSFRKEKNYYLYPGILDHFFDQNALFKVAYKPRPNLKLVLNTRYTETRGLNRYDYYRYDEAGDLGFTNPDFQTEKRFVYEGVEQVAWSGYGSWPYTGWMGKSTRYRNQYGLALTHTLSPTTFYEVKVMYNNFRVNGGMGDVRDTTATVTLIADRSYPQTQGVGQDTVVLTAESALAPLDFWPLGLFDSGLEKLTLGGTYGYAENNKAKDLTIKVNLTSQIDNINLLNVGFQYTFYDIEKDEERIQGTFRDDSWEWHVKPASFAFWVTDKLEFEGMTLNLGVRGDLRIPDEWLDWRNNPWDYHWSDVVPPDSNWTGQAENNLAGPRYNPPKKLALAPRLGISHPIGETAKIFFNWGYYFQEPPLERQYMFYTRRGSNAGQGTLNLGDPELPFIKSNQYEIGYEHNLWNMFRISASAYYKDVKNLLKDRIRYHADDSKREDGLAPHYWTAGGNRYITSQGLEVRLEKRVGRLWTAWFNYNYEEYSRGVRGFRTFYEDTTRAPIPFDFASENRSRPGESRFNLGVDIHTPGQFGPKILKSHPFADLNLNVLLWWRQQPTFTYNPEKLAAPYSPNDNMRWVPHWGINMTLTKRFSFGAINPVFYLEVYNLLNTKNMFRGSFSPANRISAFENYVAAVIEAGAKPGERPDLALEAIGNNPENVEHNPVSAYVPFALYLNPRQIWFGFRFEIN